jgi:TPR repeat protein
MELIQRAEDIDKQLEEERSKRMFEAWQNSQEAELNPKQQGVKVIKTLVKETKKKRNEKSNQSSENCRQQAQALLNQAAYEHGQPEAAVQLGNTLLKQASDSKLDRSAQEKLVTEALRLFQKAGQSGSRVGWYNHGHLLWTGFPPYENDGDEEHPVGMEESLHDQIVPADMHEAMESFIKAIDLSCYDSMYLVGVHRLTMGGKENYLSGTRLIERAANAGHGGALYYLALLHLNGEPHIGLEPCSLQEFVERLDKAADAGNVDARFVRGHSYYHGTEGYPQNFSKALDDFLKAADEGHADAAVSAGAMFHNGVGAPADQTKAFELYQLAGELGSEEGWANVVDCWRQGLGVPKSEDTAKYIEDTMLKKNTSPQ